MIERQICSCVLGIVRSDKYDRNCSHLTTHNIMLWLIITETKTNVRMIFEVSKLSSWKMTALKIHLEKHKCHCRRKESSVAWSNGLDYEDNPLSPPQIRPKGLFGDFKKLITSMFTAQSIRASFKRVQIRKKRRKSFFCFLKDF